VSQPDLYRLTHHELKKNQFNPIHFLERQKFCNLVSPTTY